MLFFQRLCLLFLCASLCTLPAGCGGESTQDKMMRIAKERAARNRAEKADEAEQEKNAAQAKPVEPAKAEVAADKAPAEDTPADAPKEETKPAEKNVVKAAGAPVPAKNESSPAASAESSATGNMVASGPATSELPTELANLPPRDQLLAFSRYGESVAYTGATQSIGIFDVQSKQLIRQVFNPDITPFSMAMNDDGSRLIVGGIGGTFKVFPLGQQQGLDRFQQSRQQRRDAAPPRKGHEGPVTATAINRSGDLVATAGADGMVKLWSNNMEEPLKLTSDASSFIAVKSYQNDQLVLGASPDNRILFWSLGKKNYEAREFPDGKLTASPTCLIAGYQDKGILVGDAQGQVSMWIAEGEQLVKSQFQAHREPIIGLGLINDGKTLLTATKGGELFRWSLPIAPQIEIKTLQPSPLLVAANRDDAVGVVSRDRNLDLYSLADGKPVRRHTLSGTGGKLTAVAFANDGEVVALADDQGRIDYQTRDKKVIAVTQVGKETITHIATAPRSKRATSFNSILAMATADGKIQVSPYPQLQPTNLSTFAGEIAASSSSGTESVVARGNQLTYLRHNPSGGAAAETLSSSRVPSGQVTALSIDSGLALIGTSTGEVWSWQCSIPNTTPEKAEIGSMREAISAVSLSSKGRVWVCDASGSIQITAFRGKNDAKKATAPADAVVAPTPEPTPLVRLAADGSVAGRIVVAGNRKIRSQAQGVDVTSMIDEQGRGSAVGQFASMSVFTPIANAGWSEVLPTSAPELTLAKSGQKWWRIQGEKADELSLPSGSKPLAVSGNADRIVASDDSGVSVYRLSGNQAELLAKLPDSLGQATAAAWDETSQRLLLALADQRIVSIPVDQAGNSSVTELKEFGKTSALVSKMFVLADSSGVVVRDSNSRIQVFSGEKANARYDSGEAKFIDFAVAGQDVFLATEAGTVSRLRPSDSAPVAIELSMRGKVTHIAATDRNSSQTRVAMLTDQSEWITTGGSFHVATVQTMKAPKKGKVISLSVGENGLIEAMASDGTVMRLAAPAIATVDKATETAACDDGSLVAFAEDGTNLKILRYVGGNENGSGMFIAQELPPLPAKIVGLASLPNEPHFAVAMQDGSVARIVPGQRDDNVLVRATGGVPTPWNKPVKINLQSATRVFVRHDLGSQTGKVLAVDFEANTTKWVDASDVPSVGNPPAASGRYEVNGKVSLAEIHGETLAVQLANSVSLLNPDGTKTAELKSGNIAFTTMTLAPKGDRVATCDRIGQLTVWDKNGQSLSRSQLPIQSVSHLLFSSDGSQLLAADERRLIVFDVASGSIITQLSLSQPIKRMVHWNADTVRFLTEDGNFRSLPIPSSDWTASLDGRPTGMAWASDGSRLVIISSTGQLLELEATSGAEIRRINVGGGGLKQVVTLTNGREFAVLNEDSTIFIVPAQGAPVKLSSRSALGLTAISVDESVQWLYAVNDLGEVVVYDLLTPDKPAQVVPSSLSVGMIQPIGGTQFVVASKTDANLTVIDAKTRRDQVDRTLSRISDIGFLPDGSFAVVADGTRRVKMVPVTQGTPRSLEAGEVNVQKLAIHPTGVRVAAIGESTSDRNHALLIWETVTQQLQATISLTGQTTEVVYSRDGGLIAVGFQDGRCEVYDGTSGELLEAMPPVEGLNSIAFASDNSRLLLGHAGGNVTVQAISVLGKVKAADDPVISLSFHGADRYLLAATMKGEISLWNRAALKSPQARFQGVQANVRFATISADGQYALAVFEDEKNSTAVWKTSAINGATGPIPPHLVVANTVPSTSANFTSDSKFLVVGGSDGLIRAWSLDENREIARFKGHAGSIAAIAPLKEQGRFVSGGADRSIRSWRFPSSLPAPGAEVPDGGLSDTTEVRDVEPPRLDENADEEDPWDAARQALIAGTADTANAIGVLDLIEGNEAAKSIAKESLNRILSMEQTDTSTAESLSQERRRLAKSRREIVATEMAKIQATYSGGFSNLYFAAPTNFKFGLEKTFRPVELLFSDRFLYAARPSSLEPVKEKLGRYRKPDEIRAIADKKQDTNRNKLDEDGNIIVEEKDPDSTDGDNGALLSWDYRYSQLQAHAWSIEDLSIKELYALPQAAGVFSAPQMMLFNQDGSSRKFSTAESWTTTNWKDSDKQFLAIGTAGGNRVESDILKLFDISELVSETVKPVSQYRSFEGIITAMAFASKHSKIAFAVRERSVHRLFVADIETMQLNLIEEVRHAKPWIEEKNGNATRVSDASPGITTLAFSPDDELLIAHGNYNKKEYRFTGWKLDDELKPALLKPQFMVTNDKEPFFDSIGSKSVWFINSDRYGRQDRDPSGSRVKKIVVRRKGGFSIINLANGSIERDIPYLTTQHGQPIFSISDNGRWIMMGDDRGMAYIWDAITGEKFAITIDEESERQIKASDRRPDDLPERPAHTGPIVGVALSDPDPGKEYPAFAATCGEENRIKVWELFPIIELQSQPLRARETTTAVSQ
ncbi:hypothetical protein [Neorhodopirellula pilleata]|nr:hypothetical protein [Neorhodopirellula pilleata]